MEGARFGSCARNFEFMKNDIKKKNIENFFKQRAKSYNKSNPLKTVIYQDKNPALAIKRDKFEKKK